MSNTSRRKFLLQATSVAASFIIVPRYVLGRGYTAPSDMFTIGFIGTGKQARGLLNSFKKQPVRIISGAEVDSLKLAKFKALAEKAFAGAPGLAGSAAAATARRHVRPGGMRRRRVTPRAARRRGA